MGLATQQQKPQTIAIIASGDISANPINASQLADSIFTKDARVVVLCIKRDLPTPFFYLTDIQSIKTREEAKAMAELHTLIPSIKNTKNITYKVLWASNPAAEALHEARILNADMIVSTDPPALAEGWAEQVAGWMDTLIGQKPFQNQKDFIITTPEALTAQSSATQKSRNTLTSSPTTNTDPRWEKTSSNNPTMKSTTAVRSFGTLPHKVTTNAVSANPPAHETPKVVSK
ncbi:hypothetical protein BH10PSE19_BH10PSE19_16820 [soil metagenome]